MARVPLSRDIRFCCARVRILLGYMTPVLCHRQDQPFLGARERQKEVDEVDEVDEEHGGQMAGIPQSRARGIVQYGSGRRVRQVFAKVFSCDVVRFRLVMSQCHKSLGNSTDRRSTIRSFLTSLKPQWQYMFCCLCRQYRTCGFGKG